MHHARAVRNLERGEHAGNVFDGLFGSHLAGVNYLAQQASADKFHHDERSLTGVAALVERLFFASVVDAHDGRVGHPGRGLCLLTELALELWVVSQIGLQQLDRNRATEPGVNTFVNLGHAASTDQRTQSVPTCN